MTLIKRVGLQVSDDFPHESYECVYSRVQSHCVTNPHFLLFIGGWHGLVHRFRAAGDAADIFCRVVGSNPSFESQYQEERELMYLLVAGLSSIECLFFGVHAVGAMLCPSEFPMLEEEDQRLVTLAITRKRLRHVFPDCPGARRLAEVVTLVRGSEWEVQRNVLMHRTHPGRDVVIGRAQVDRWKIGIPVDRDSVLRKRAWLSEMVREAVAGAETFVGGQLGEP